MVEQFQNKEFPILILSLKAGGTGLNLTAANHVIHYDRWWNPAVEIKRQTAPTELDRNGSSTFIN
ncbi:C-terminal helicase domain-containing protein [Bacillus licheniformis]|nr:C-terminal helicase domain-containing protein [Bacillus licheniformis]